MTTSADDGAAGNARKWAAKRRADKRPHPAQTNFLPLPLPLELDERYTTRETLDWCMRKAGVDAFDLDVAACAEAHCAERYFTITDDGLTRPWTGRVWCNNPFSDIEPWVLRARGAAVGEADVVAQLLPATRSEQSWWQDHVEPIRDGRGLFDGVGVTTHFLPGRTRFGIPGNREGIGVGSPPFGCVLLVWRKK